MNDLRGRVVSRAVVGGLAAAVMVSSAVAAGYGSGGPGESAGGHDEWRERLSRRDHAVWHGAVQPGGDAGEREADDCGAGRV